jgi:hypothetical protein
VAEKPVSIWLAAYPSASIDNESLVARLLDCMESRPKFSPVEWGLFERDRTPFDRTKVLETTHEPDEQFFLHRDKSVKYVCSVSLLPNNLRFVSCTFHKSLSPAAWADVEEFSDGLTAAIEARFGILHIFRPGPANWSNEAEKLERWMEMAAQPFPGTFDSCGPPGLAMRTYFGGDILDLVGENRLAQSKAGFTKLPWGGARLDLASNLWNLSRSEAATLAKRSMDSLAAADAFAEPVFHWDGRTVDFSPSPAWQRLSRGKS